MDRPFYAQIEEGKYLGNTIPHMDYRQYQRIRGLVLLLQQKIGKRRMEEETGNGRGMML